MRLNAGLSRQRASRHINSGAGRTQGVIVNFRIRGSIDIEIVRRVAHTSDMLR